MMVLTRLDKIESRYGKYWFKVNTLECGDFVLINKRNPLITLIGSLSL